MRTLITASLTLCATFALLAFPAYGQRSDSPSFPRALNDDDDSTAGETDRDSYTPQYGSDRTRTSRDYGDQQAAGFDPDDPHSSTRTDRLNRFDRATSQFEDDEHASRSFNPRGDRSNVRRQQAITHDYASGLWRRAMQVLRGDNDYDTADDWADTNSQFPADELDFRSTSSEGLAAWWSNWMADNEDEQSEDEAVDRRSRRSHFSQRRSSLTIDDDAPHTVPAEVTFGWMVAAQGGAQRLRELQHAYELLQQLDEDGDGHITRTELRDRIEHALARWIEYGFERLDADGDDALSRSEAARSMLQERFDRLDANGDGLLTRSELRQSATNASAVWGPDFSNTYLSEGASEDDEQRR